jgi:hypothetical protein
LSIVFGTPTTFTPSAASFAAAPSVSSPPIGISASTFSSRRFSITFVAPSAVL